MKELSKIQKIQVSGNNMQKWSKEVRERNKEAKSNVQKLHIANGQIKSLEIYIENSDRYVADLLEQIEDLSREIARLRARGDTNSEITEVANHE